MATLILRLEIDPVTKKKNVLVKYISDSDALPSIIHADGARRDILPRPQSGKRAGP